MRKEASADLWKMLYNLADELKELKPWEDLWDMDLIGIQENGRDEPVFCSVIGKETREKGIALYDGTGGLASFQKTARAASASQIEYRISEQQALVCFWGSRIDVPEEQQKMIRNLEKNITEKITGRVSPLCCRVSHLAHRTKRKCVFWWKRSYSWWKR